MASGECPACKAVNDYTSTTCELCGAPLPWAKVARAAAQAPRSASRPTGPVAAVPVRGASKSAWPRWAGGCGCSTLLVIWGLSCLGGSTHTPAKMEWNVNALLPCVTIEQVEAKLGKPDYSSKEMVFPDGDDTASKDWGTMDVSYHSQTRIVIDYFIGCDEPGGACSDQARLLDRGALTFDDPHYTLKFVPAMGHDGEYTGVTVTPQ